ncbi:hypothetical protein [Vibrio coralliilyticus]|uniref:hypothetical protein n=1 Tax=Vibrio coralliilyticus TaxID=190893 RepID=UPI001E3C8397|nr:hypothetical protein [Vibrio coralliilyticus]MCC2525555.1 hypothetical protein [Vibrio coralliilyticus]
MKRLLLATALTASFAASATNLEISLFYSEGYTSDSSILVSSEIIGFYRSIDAANTLFSDSSANLVLVPAKIEALDEATFAANYNVFGLLNDMSSGSLEASTDNAGHLQLGIARDTFNGNSGYGEAINEFRFVGLRGGGTDYKKVAVTGNILNRYEASGYKHFMAHEVLHAAVGASHTASDAALFEYNSSGNNFGYGQTCDDGSASLMDSNFVNNASTVTQKISGAAGCASGGGNVVSHINTFAPEVPAHASYLNMNTMTMSVSENTSTSEYEFTVTRTKDTTSAINAYLHISGTNATVGNELQPVTVAFAANETSKTVTVPFSSIHAMFNDADPYDDKVYAVAISEKEVMNSLVDLTAINTTWSGDSSTASTSGGGGGGSIGIFTLLAMGLLRLRRNR